jgi:hypothetical protein
LFIRASCFKTLIRANEVLTSVPLISKGEEYDKEKEYNEESYKKKKRWKEEDMNKEDKKKEETQEKNEEKGRGRR